MKKVFIHKVSQGNNPDLEKLLNKYGYTLTEDINAVYRLREVTRTRRHFLNGEILSIQITDGSELIILEGCVEHV